MLLFLNLYLRSISISKYKLSGSAQILIAEKIQKLKRDAYINIPYLHKGRSIKITPRIFLLHLFIHKNHNIQIYSF